MSIEAVAVPGNIPVGPTFVIIFLIVAGLVAIAMAVLFFRDRRK
jgi:hypothetical protein